MKSLLFCLLLTSGAVYAQRAQFSIFVPIESPVKSEMPHMSGAGGIGVGFGFKLNEYIPVFFEMKGNIGSYGSQTIQQTYTFDNGDVTNVNVSYNNSISKMMLGAKYMIGQDYRRVRGFITPQIGYASMKTGIRIADPEDEDDCQPLEKRTNLRHVGGIYGIESGLEINLGGLLDHKLFSNQNKHRLLLSYSYARGFQPFEYANVKYLENGTVEDHVHGDRNLNAKFINMTTNSVHEHKIAEVYRSNFSMWGIQIGYICTF